MFRPARLTVGIWCLIVLIAMFLNVYILTESTGGFAYLSLALLSVALMILFFPLLKNQKIAITNEIITISSFGKLRELSFLEDLSEVVVKDSEIVSYRFEKFGKYYQISPYAYHEGKQLNAILTNLYKRMERHVAAVER